ncbi:hypothetical protein LTR08_006668 [Meristemomyces frigidus]|nr:hypothetical protein LTR08_006668 [Meristemomyces frigidus]
MPHYITSHDGQGRSVFSHKVPTEHHSHAVPGGAFALISTAHTFSPNLSTEADI